MKAAAMKTKKGPPLKDSQKGKSTRLKKGPPARLIKSTPGFSLYSGDEIVTKPASKSKETLKPSKSPRLINGDSPGVVSHEDNIVSQVQLVESKSKEQHPPSSHADLLTGGPKTQKIRPTSPDLTGIPGVSEVRTPFNKRLISSTPEPERLFSVHDHDRNINMFSHSTNHHLTNLPAQLVPERDTETNTKPAKPSTFDVIGSLLMTQRQNQVLWQQQLEQFKQPPVVKVSEKPSHSAFQQWKGQHGGAANGSSVNSVLSPYEIVSDYVPENQLKAEWIIGESHPNNTETPSTGKMSDRSDLSEQKIDPSPYNAQGAISDRVVDSFHVKSNENVVVKNLASHERDNIVLDGKSGGGKQSIVKKKVTQSKSKEETSSTDKMSSMSRATSKTSTLGVKVLPVASRHNIESSREQARPNMPRKAVNRKHPMSKVSTVSEASEPVKKKKVLHVNLPRDERGTDIPPFVDDDEATDLCSSPLSQPTENDLKVFANDSLSVCGEEINTLLSKESEKSGDSHAASCSEDLVQSESLESRNCIDVEYKLTDRKLEKSDDFVTNVPYSGKNQSENFVTNAPYNEKDPSSDFVTNVSYCSGKHLKENQNFIENSSGEEGAVLDNPVEQVNKLAEKEVVGKSIEIVAVENEQVSTDESVDGLNVNQNHYGYDHDERFGGRRFRLHFLEKMADKTLMDIVCKLNLKATAIRDTELRDLIDDMIYNTDATLAREDGRFRSSQAFFMDENSRLKKRLHTLNKQLDAKERQERQADLYPGVSNNDIMHLERKNLYLRQEKDRLDNQVTNLLEEKAKWLVKQQDLVKTISLKDREILKLEGKFQEEKKTLHKAVDEAAKNSQGVHFKLSVADREIANLEQRVKAKDREIIELKDSLKDMKDDLQCCVDSRTDKNREITRLQDLVNTLKVGVNEVMKAYEATAHSQPSTSNQRQGIDSLRRLVTDSLSSSHAPEQNEAGTHQGPGRQYPSYHGKDGRGMSFSTSTRHDLPPPPPSPPQPHQRYHQIPRERGQAHAHWRQPSHQQQKQQKHNKQQQQAMTRDVQRVRDDAQRFPHRSTHRADTDDGLDWYARDSSLLQAKDKNARSRHNSGSALTVKAVEDHNRRLSPVDRTLWHSLDTGHVMPPFTGEEPYHSDSEIHLANSKTRRRMDQERLGDFEARGLSHQQRRRRKSDDFTDRTNRRDYEDSVRQTNTGILNRQEMFEDRAAGTDSHRERGWSQENLDYERTNRDYGSAVRHEARNYDLDPSERIADELESVTLNDADNESDIGGSRYSVSDYFRKYPIKSTSRFPSPKEQNQQGHQPTKRFPMKSKDYWVDSGTADDQEQEETTMTHQQQYSTEPTRSFQLDDRYPSLESVSLSDQNMPSTQNRDRIFSSTEKSDDHHKSSHRQNQLADDYPRRSIRHGKIVQNPGVESQSRYDYDGSNPNPLSSSHPILRSEGISSSSHQPPTTLSSQFPSILSTSLPASSHQHHSDGDCREDQFNLSQGSAGNESLCQRFDSYQGNYHSSEVDGRPQRGERSSHRYMEKAMENGKHVNSLSRSHQPSVTFRDPSVEDYLSNQPSQSSQSEFRNGRTSFPPHSSPVTTSDISISRRATKGSETSQHDFFRGTELSASCSSISDTDLPQRDYSSNHPNMQGECGEESFNTGIASLDDKIAALEAKINRTKAAFS